MKWELAGGGIDFLLIYWGFLGRIFVDLHLERISFRVWLDNMKANFRRCCGCWSCAADAKKLQMDVMLGGSSVGIELKQQN